LASTLANTVVLGLVGIGAAVVLPGCQRQQAPPPERRTAVAAEPASTKPVRIVTIDPDPAKPLKVGDAVAMRVVATYTLDADAGIVALVIQGSDMSMIEQEMETVSRGDGKVALRADFTVPDVKSVQVFVPLMAQGESRASAVDTRFFKVVSP
jgi:hypothetical protein